MKEREHTTQRPRSLRYEFVKLAVPTCLSIIRTREPLHVSVSSACAHMQRSHIRMSALNAPTSGEGVEGRAPRNPHRTCHRSQRVRRPEGADGQPRCTSRRRGPERARCARSRSGGALAHRCAPLSACPPPPCRGWLPHRSGSWPRSQPSVPVPVGRGRRFRLLRPQLPPPLRQLPFLSDQSQGSDLSLYRPPHLGRRMRRTYTAASRPETYLGRKPKCSEESKLDLVGT